MTTRTRIRRVVLNRRFEEQASHDSEIVRNVTATATQVMRRAGDNSPTGPTGRYREGFGIEFQNGWPVVVNDDFAAVLVEFGSVNNRPYGPVRRAARELGLRLEPAS